MTTTTLKTNALRTAVRAKEVTPAAAKKIEQLATDAAKADAFDPTQGATQAAKLTGKQKALFQAAFQELAGKAGAALAALAAVPEGPTTTAAKPSLFTQPELAAWSMQAAPLRDAKDYDGLERARSVLEGVRLQRASQHPGPVADALLLHVGTRGAQTPTIDDVFNDVGRRVGLDSPYGAPRSAGIDVAVAARAHDTPENRRLLHSILQGLRAMPTTVAGSGAVKYFLGTGSFAGKDKDGVGLLSSANKWAKDAGWKNDDTTRVITALFQDHYGSGDWNGVGKLLTQPKGGFQGYPDGPLWDAARESEYSASPFAMTHSERNTTFIDALMKELEGRGLGAPLAYAAPKLNIKLTPSVAKKAVLAQHEAKWDAAIAKWNAGRSDFHVEGKAKDQSINVWDRAIVTRDGQKEQVTSVGGGYGHFGAVVVTTPEGDVKEVFALDPDKGRGRLSKDMLKDPSRPWLALV